MPAQSIWWPKYSTTFARRVFLEPESVFFQPGENFFKTFLDGLLHFLQSPVCHQRNRWLQGCLSTLNPLASETMRGWKLHQMVGACTCRGLDECWLWRTWITHRLAEVGLRQIELAENCTFREGGEQIIWLGYRVLVNLESWIYCIFVVATDTKTTIFLWNCHNGSIPVTFWTFFLQVKGA